MKTKLYAAAFMLLVVAGVGVTRLVMAEDKAPTTAPSTQPSASTEAVNKTCLVSGDKVDPKAPTVTYEGKVIGFCCEDCIKDFNKDPKKYVAKLK